MLFNSFDFLLFFPIVCIIYYIIPINKYRNYFLLLTSYYFYMNWEPIYALLILLSTLTTYGCGLLLDSNKNNRSRKIYLISNLLLNFGILFLFKYYNFINESIFNVLNHIGIGWNTPSFKWLLPVGISFYTFQAIGYSIDVYRKDIKAEHNFWTYALFVSFFPQLVAGPIERSRNLLPQFKEKKEFNLETAAKGFRLMLWGYFMKLCVGDRLAIYVDSVYNNLEMHNGSSMLLATLFFTIQIYCDFAGYSLIAIGCARIMGYKLMDNFRRPYFSQSIKEFWSRWHISLSTWFKDYLYIPLGGNRVGKTRHLINLFITFLVSGVWHGAAWNFIIWGALHGLYLVIENLLSSNKSSRNIFFRLLKQLYTFILVVFAWIFFRANSTNDAFYIINNIFTNTGPIFRDLTVFSYGLISLSILMTKEIIDEYYPKIKFLDSNNIIVRYTSQLLIIIFILLFAVLNGGQFIYFQF
ncbi:MAG: MBOAT family O-acyltransferase [Bacteroidales bacterium]